MGVCAPETASLRRTKNRGAVAKAVVNRTEQKKEPVELKEASMAVQAKPGRSRNSSSRNGSGLKTSLTRIKSPSARMASTASQS